MHLSDYWHLCSALPRSVSLAPEAVTSLHRMRLIRFHKGGSTHPWKGTRSYGKTLAAPPQFALYLNQAVPKGTSAARRKITSCAHLTAPQTAED